MAPLMEQAIAVNEEAMKPGVADKQQQKQVEAEG
jgi:hypothetical protein